MTTRRRFLTIMAGLGALSAAGAQAAIGSTQWRGIALGADAQIILDHPDADRLIAEAVREIRRLEAIFSLYQSNSQLARLNASGTLENPAFELIELLSISSAIVARTNGAFDPTVQSLWEAYAFAHSAGQEIAQNDFEAALETTGWQHVRYSPQQVHFERRGVKLTLNGIAQGYIADKVTQLFQRNGVKDVLVNTGEISALGGDVGQDHWSVRLGQDGDYVALSGNAIATSAPQGTTFDAGGQVGHILDPRTGYPANAWREVSVISKTAAEADGLSTAFCLMSRAEIEAAKGDSTVYVS